MDTILFYGIIAILCATLQSLGIWRHGLLFGFLITTTLLAIHYDFGTDYWAYYDWFEESLSMPFPNSFADFLNMSRDPGWDLLNLLFGKFFGQYGFFVMVACLSIVEGVCYYIFINKYVPQKWFWFAMAIYVFNNTFFVLTFSMMRQSFVMALLLLCFICIQEQKIILPLVIILLISTIHNSVLLFLPFVFVSLIPIDNQKALSFIILVLWLFFLIVSSILEPMLSHFASLTETFARYVETYSESSEMTYGLGYLLRILPFFYLLYGLFNNQFEKQDIPMILVWSVTIILTPFCMIIPLFSRLLFYFELAGFVVFPRLFSICRLTPIKLLLVISVLLFVTYTLYGSFYNPESVYFDSYLKFHTIFEVI